MVRPASLATVVYSSINSKLISCKLLIEIVLTFLVLVNVLKGFLDSVMEYANSLWILFSRSMTMYCWDDSIRCGLMAASVRRVMLPFSCLMNLMGFWLSESSNILRFSDNLLITFAIQSSKIIRRCFGILGGFGWG